MIDQYKRKDLREESTEKKMQVPIRRRTIFVSLIVLGIVIVAIAGGWYLLQPSGEGRQITIFTISNVSLTTPPVNEHPGTLAPNFSLTDPDGNSSWLSDFRGKVVVIDFMATWCPSCRQQMSRLKVIWEKENYRDKIVLMSIDVDPTESAETLRSFAQEFPYATWIWARGTANLGQVYQVTAIPKTVIIDQDGYIRFTHTGVTYASTFIEEIDQLLD
ncbi:MAG: TlpA family protein disulfide reductase [Candidatus Bathyarchaeia archaeon]